MIFDMLQNQTFMFFFIITFIIFLILYMWRKVASLESYVFILEKRLNLVKKDICNKQHFSSSQSEDNINPMSNECNINCNNDDDMCVFKCSTGNDLNDIIMKEVFGSEDNKSNITFSNETDFNLPVATSTDVKITDVDDDDDDDDDNTNNQDDIEDVLDKVLDDKHIVFEDQKDGNNLTRQKLVKMPISELKELCVLNNLQTDGTKPNLINKLLGLTEK